MLMVPHLISEYIPSFIAVAGPKRFSTREEASHSTEIGFVKNSVHWLWSTMVTLIMSRKKPFGCGTANHYCFCYYEDTSTVLLLAYYWSFYWQQLLLLACYCYSKHTTTTTTTTTGILLLQLAYYCYLWHTGAATGILLLLLACRGHDNVHDDMNM